MQTGGGRPRRNDAADESFRDIQPPGIRFEILQNTSRYIKRFKLRGRETTMRIRQPPPAINTMAWLEGAFHDLLTHITNSCEGSDYVGISFSAKNLAHGPVWLSFRPARDYAFQDIWGLITSVAQSAGSLNIDDACTFKTCIVKGIEGSGRVRLDHESVAKKSILTIRNDDNLCLPRSLVAALAHAERGEIRTGELHSKWQRIRQLNGSVQREAALELNRAASVRMPRNGCGVKELSEYQAYLARDGIAIVAFEFLTLGARKKKSIFNGTNRVFDAVGAVRHTLYILYYERSHHFQPILNLRGATASAGFCTTCESLYSQFNHRCSRKKCPRCFVAPSCNPHTRDTIHCVGCNRVFFGEQCLRNHRSVTAIKRDLNASVCDALKRCPDCFRAIRSLVPHKHVCNESYCKICKSQQQFNHLCFMRPIKQDRDLKKKLFIFYDFETQQCEILKGTADKFVHEPTLCVAQRVCTHCCEQDSIEQSCEYCGAHEFVFRHSPVAQLVELAMQKIKGFTRTFVIAHNAGGFDAQFILRYLIEEKKTQLPSLIMNGTKIITMRVGNTIFLDSLHYLHMPLSKLPKAFGLTGGITKGTFPHLFNTPEHQSYVGPLPDVEYYSPDTMSAEIRKNVFLPWYDTLKKADYVFDFAKEIVSYCRDDVTILRRACLVFRKMFIDIGNVCPFDEATTIASACFRIFRKNFLKDDSIGIIPTSGYRWTHNQSKKAISWLVWEEHCRGHRIIHAARTREFKIPQNLYVDGYYERDGRAFVLQFHGCYWHGCPRCFLVNRDRAHSDGVSMNDRHERTIAVAYKIRKGGYVLSEIWECEYDRLLETNEAMRVFVQEHSLVTSEPLNPRDAFFGGRTENMVTLYDVTDTEQIRYVDVCSLYPYICKFGKFPIGHPKIYVGDECMELTGPDNTDLRAVEGLVKCTVLPPRNLYHPVLPVRMHHRLLFALCRSCCEVMNQEECMHEDPAERVFEGTWVVDELRKAISCGYQVIAVAEIWQYKITQFNRDSMLGGHFTEYINTFLKIKQESSGWPKNCLDDVSRERYIDDFTLSEGVKLDRESIEKNPGLRSVAKLCLNSFWGKFGQRENLPQTVVISSRQKLMDLVYSPEYETTGMLPVNHKTLYVNYIKNDDAVTPSGMASPVIAAYTTAQARLKLYSYLEALGPRALYCDTDSVIYVTKNEPNEYEPPVGQLLGDLTDELDNGCYIKSFVSGGPKFYSYIVCAPDGSESEVCKVKGVTLNFENSSLINYKSIREFIVGEQVQPIELYYDAIRRTEFHQVVTCAEKKSCKPSSVKRRRNGDYGSLPYGYKY